MALDTRAALLVPICALLGCLPLQDNPRNCRLSPGICPSGTQCDRATDTCQPLGNGPQDMATGGGQDLDMAGPPPDIAGPPDLTGAPLSPPEVQVSSGTAKIGSAPDAGAADESPQLMPSISTFYMDQHEVTVGDYRACVKATVCTPPDTMNVLCNYQFADREDHPVNCVSWNQATAFCSWVNRRLPTEFEWEYAARGPMGSLYPFGNAAPVDQLCWKQTKSCPVDVMTAPRTRTLLGAANAMGLADLAGDVQEWTSSYYCTYANLTSCDGTMRVYRGSSWSTANDAFVRASIRFKRTPTYQDPYLGFRCARTP